MGQIKLDNFFFVCMIGNQPLPITNPGTAWNRLEPPAWFRFLLFKDISSDNFLNYFRAFN